MPTTEPNRPRTSAAMEAILQRWPNSILRYPNTLALPINSTTSVEIRFHSRRPPGQLEVVTPGLASALTPDDLCARVHHRHSGVETIALHHVDNHDGITATIDAARRGTPRGLQYGAAEPTTLRTDVDYVTPHAVWPALSETLEALNDLVDGCRVTRTTLHCDPETDPDDPDQDEATHVSITADIPHPGGATLRDLRLLGVAVVTSDLNLRVRWQLSYSATLNDTMGTNSINVVSDPPHYNALTAVNTLARLTPEENIAAARGVIAHHHPALDPELVAGGPADTATATRLSGLLAHT